MYKKLNIFNKNEIYIELRQQGMGTMLAHMTKKIQQKINI